MDINKNSRETLPKMCEYEGRYRKRRLREGGGSIKSRNDHVMVVIEIRGMIEDNG